LKIVNIVENTVPFGSAMANSYINFSAMTESVVAIKTDVYKEGKPVIGYGFNSVGRYACTSILKDRMIPKILNADPSKIYRSDFQNLDPEKIYQVLIQNEKPGGHGDRAHAIGAIDMAVWDVVAKIEEKPLCKVLADAYGNGICDEKVNTYAAGGYYYENNGLEKLKDELHTYLDMGFRDIKIKIGGAPIAEDIKRLEAALSLVNDDGRRLMVDANGKFGLRQALDFAFAIKQLKLKWYEEPLDPLDYEGHAVLAEYYPEAIATGENLFSCQDMRNLFRHGGLRPDRDYIQMDCPLSYGLIEYMKVLDMMKERGWSSRQMVPHGGNLFCLHIAAGLHLGGNECYPGVFQPFGGYTDDLVYENGAVKLPDLPGIGFEGKGNLWRILKEIAV
jgi:L-alanine-DL-glutamate epimerase-like enolase superfamily enzyme